MPDKVPETGSAALTYDKAADIGVFDGRIVTPKKRAAAGGTRSSKATDEQLAADRRSFLVPLIAGLVLVAAGAGIIIYTVTSVVVSDRIAAQAQATLRDRFAERQALAAQGISEPVDPTAAAQPLPSEDDFDDSGDVPIIFGAAAGDLTVSDPTKLAGWQTEKPPAQGDAMGRVVIPDAGIDWVFVEGVSVEDLRQGPGHMPRTAVPGQFGNAVLSGHRTTYGAPFGNLDVLEPGDRFTVETLIGTHTYEVVSTIVVRPSDAWVVQPMEGAWLTLITCTPRYSSRQRLIVFSKLVDGPNAALAASWFGSDYVPPVPPEGAAPLPTPILVAPTTTTTSTTTTLPPTTTTTTPGTSTTEGTATTTTTSSTTTTTTTLPPTTTTTEP